jgi:hypothetical protein
MTWTSLSARTAFLSKFRIGMHDTGTGNIRIRK